MEEKIVSSIIAAQIGTEAESDLITQHMEQYFKRWPSYKDKFTPLEWHHIFLDFLDFQKSQQPKISPPTSNKTFLLPQSTPDLILEGLELLKKVSAPTPDNSYEQERFNLIIQELGNRALYNKTN